MTSSDGKVTLSFPAGALQQNTTIDIQPASQAPDGYVVPGTTYSFGPDGAHFAKAVTAIFHYDPARLPTGANEQELVAVKLDGGNRIAATSTVDTAAHTVSAQLTGFSTWTVICCIPNPAKTPTSFLATYNAQTNSIQLTWQLVLVNGASPSTELDIERAEKILPLDTDFRPLATLTPVDANFDGRGFDDSGGGTFQAQLPVWYRIRGASPGRLPTYVDDPATSLVIIPAPPGTLTLTATPTSSSSVALNWNNIPDVVSYQLERASGASSFSVIAGPANTALQFTDTGLTPATSYQYRLTANLSGGATSVATAAVTTPGLGVSAHIYVSDTNPAANVHRIVRMDDIAGHNWTKLTGKADGTDPFTNPFGLAVDAAAQIYVADGVRIVKTDITGASWTTLSGNAAGTDHFTSLEGIAVDGSGNIYVSDSGGATQVARIVKTDITGSSWTTLGTTRGAGVGQFGCPGQVYLDANYIFVADRCNNRIVRMTDIAGTGWATVSQNTAGTDHFSSPRGVATDSNGVIWVGDELALPSRLVRTAIDGSNWSVTTLPLTSTGASPNPTSLAFGPSGALYVTAWHFNYLVELNGATSTVFTTEPNGDTFSRTYGVAVGP